MQEYRSVCDKGAPSQPIHPPPTHPPPMQEYRSVGDKGEVRRLLRELAVPFFHHEVVKQV